jgi:hypothetical protein
MSVGEIYKTILRKIWMETDIEQSSLPLGKYFWNSGYLYKFPCF